MRQPVQFEAEGFSEGEGAEEYRGRARDADNLPKRQCFLRVAVFPDQHVSQHEIDQPVTKVANHHPEEERVAQEQQHRRVQLAMVGNRVQFGKEFEWLYRGGIVELDRRRVVGLFDFEFQLQVAQRRFQSCQVTLRQPSLEHECVLALRQFQR